MFLKLLLPLFIASLLAAPHTTRKPINDFVLEGEGDRFALTEVSYAANESFVYTSVANFENGQACGLAFGAVEDDHYWVFNIDRYANRTKLLYFTVENGNVHANEVAWDYFVGNDKTVESEFNVINPKVRNNGRFHLKMVLSVVGEDTYAEFFIDNIKRFGVDTDIKLNNYHAYEGGSLGYNVFNSKTKFTNTTYGKSDYTYYTELYRNQYHFSQYSHWNNDPNGLVYYDGWYHLYYQTNPFDKNWGDMFWGHARSRDLVHWQELPIALFPDDGNMGQGLGVGLAWSGIAMVYHQGMSEEIDNRGWFPSGEGLLGYYTRDGERQDQVIIVSNDGGITWEKKWLISQHLCVDGYKVDCRDPSIFEMKKDGDKVTLWGMVLSGGTQDKIWYLKSEDMVNWSYAGVFDYVYPECVTVKQINGGHYVMSVSSRYYALGDFFYNELNGMIEFHNLNDEMISQADFVKMDYGEDSYAAQCFYIDDEASKYYSKAVSISWFSGLPSDAESGTDTYGSVRDPWNGGGMTIPVVLDIKDNVLTQTPITLNNDDFEKENVLSVTDVDYDGTTNALEDVNSHIFELNAEIENENEADIEFRVMVSNDEYTSFGWNKTEGYYVDRGHTSDAGIEFKKHYHHRFSSGATTETTRQTFYVLADNGALELFCGDFKYNFYNLALPSPYSIGAELLVSDEVKINSLSVNNIASTWHIDVLEEGVLLLDRDNVQLDMNLGDSQEVLAYSTGGKEIAWAIVSGEEVIKLERTVKGARITALANGEAVVSATTDDETKTINVLVDNGTVDCFFELKKDNIYSGNWLSTSKGLIGTQKGGDGFIFSDETNDDFIYTASFDLSNAAAAALVFRANKDMSSYLIANYDNNAKRCKLWSNNGELANVEASVSDLSKVVISVNTDGKNVKVSLNGRELINVLIKDNDPLSGHFGLNVFNGTVTFSEITLFVDQYEFNNRDLIFEGTTEQHINAIYNINDRNSLVDSSYYKVSGKNITLSKEYIYLLKENTTYSFYVEGELASFTVKVKVGTFSDNELVIDDVTTQEGLNVSVYVGNHEINSVKVNGEEVTYHLENFVLTIEASKFNVGDNEVVVNDSVTFSVRVEEIEKETEKPQSSSNGCGGNIATTSILLSALALCGITLIVIRRRKDA